MPILKLHETFSPQALEFTEEFWWKAGLLMYLCAINPKLKESILPWEYLPFEKITPENIIRVISDNKWSTTEIIERNTHPDDAVALIWAIDNLSTEQDTSEVKMLEIELEKMKSNILSEDQKELKRKELANNEKKKLEELKIKYAFIFNFIDDVDESFWDWEVSAYCTMAAILRILDIFKSNPNYIFDNHIYFPYSQRVDEERSKKFTQNVLWTENRMEELYKEIKIFIKDKTSADIWDIIAELKEIDIPHYYSNYYYMGLDYELDEEINNICSTQEEVDEKEKELKEAKTKPLWKRFLEREKYYKDFIRKNNLRWFDKTWLYIQEDLWPDWNYWTMLEHPNIPGKFIFSWRQYEKEWEWTTSSTMPSMYLNWQIAPWAVAYPLKKLVWIYEEIIKTWLLCDDISLQLEIACKWNQVYILQVRAFRKKEIANWKMWNWSGMWTYANTFGITPRDGISIKWKDMRYIKNIAYSNDKPIKPDILQDIKIAITHVLAPFDHSMTEVAYYPNVSVFWSRETEYDFPYIHPNEEINFWSDGIDYKWEIN